jgi:xanthine dehydrogenase accessory factor
MHMDIFEEIHSRQKAGKPFVLVTIVRTDGASPRLPGAKMLVFPDGTIFDTIGGGKFEKLVIDDCLQLMESGQKHLLKRYSFTPKGKDATGMACGGEAEVFMEAFTGPNKLIIFGGGHICRELVQLTERSGFAITVIDDRDDILSGYASPITAVRTDETYQENLPSFDHNCFVVIVTRSHKIDRGILERVIQHDCAYIGMIGSKRKISGLYTALEKAGIERSRLEQVHAPIGLDIKGEGPYEIAVSILAELIAVKNGVASSRE